VRSLHTLRSSRNVSYVISCARHCRSASASFTTHSQGSTSTLAAGEHLGYLSIGTERDVKYFAMGCKAFHKLQVLTLA
jgi:hypothetical protein